MTEISRPTSVGASMRNAAKLLPRDVADARGRHIGVRNERENFQRQRAEAARRDNIIGKCGPACGRYGNWISTGVQSQGCVRGVRSLVRIIDSAAYVARCTSSWGNGLEVSTTEIIPGHCQVVKLPSGIVNSQDVAEEEQLVSEDGATNVTAIVIISGGGSWRDACVLEERHGCQGADPVELVGRAMEGVCARLQDDVSNGATGASELGGVVAGAYVNRLNGLCGRDVDLQQARSLIVIHALDLQVVE